MITGFRDRLRGGISVVFAVSLFLIFGSAAQAQWSSSSGNTTTSDKVGIGTTSPTDKLHVAGGSLSIIRNEMSVWTANNGVGGETDWTNNAYYSSGWKYRYGDEASLIQQENGNLRFSTAAPASADAAITFAERLTVLQGSNVGIGATSPGYTLDVNGTVHATNIIAHFQDMAEWVRRPDNSLPAQ